MVPARVARKVAKIFTRHIDPAEAKKIIEDIQEVSGLSGTFKKILLDIEVFLVKEERKKENVT